MSARIGPGSGREIGLAASVFSRLAGIWMGTTPPAVFTTLARTRRTFWGWLAFSAALMPFGHLSRRESELVILAVAGLRGSSYEEGHHRRLARRAGLSQSHIDAALGHGSAQFSAREQAILDATQALDRSGDLDDTQWASIQKHLSQREVVEWLLLVGNYQALAQTLHVLRIPDDPPRVVG